MGGPPPKGKTQTGLKAQFRIGSIHGRCNYSFAEKAFHKSEVPVKARDAKIKIRALKRGNRLGLTKSLWNSSTDSNIPMCQKRNNQLSKHDGNPYQHNYRAEVLPPKNRHYEQKPSHLEFDRSLLVTDKKKRWESRQPIIPGQDTQEMPVHPNLVGKPLWDNGTIVPFETMQKEREEAAARAREYRETHKFDVVGYVNPVERVKRQQRRMRERKKEIRNNPDFKNCPAETITRMLLDENGNVGGEANGGGGKKKKGPGVFKPYKTTVSRKYKTYQHSGVYEFNKLEQKWMWSDTGGEEKESKGDIVKVINPDAWNFASPGHD
jgi:hypothetical protein